MALVGATGAGWDAGLRGRGGPFTKIIPITPAGMPLDAALLNAPRLLQEAAANETGLRNYFGESPFGIASR